MKIFIYIIHMHWFSKLTIFMIIKRKMTLSLVNIFKILEFSTRSNQSWNIASFIISTQLTVVHFHGWFVAPISFIRRCRLCQTRIAAFYPHTLSTRSTILSKSRIEYTGKRDVHVAKGNRGRKGGRKKRSLISLGRFPGGPSRRFPFDEPFHETIPSFVIRPTARLHVAGEYFPVSTHSRRGKLKRPRRREMVQANAQNGTRYARKEREGRTARANNTRTHLFGLSNGWRVRVERKTTGKRRPLPRFASRLYLPGCTSIGEFAISRSLYGASRRLPT